MKVIGNLRDSDGSHANQQMQKLLDRFGKTGTVLRREAMPADGDILVQWGFKPTSTLITCIVQRKPFVILDLGYFDPNRYAEFSVSINGFHGLSMQPDFVSRLAARPHPRLQAWREESENIVIIGQVDGDQSLRQVDVAPLMHRAALDAHNKFRKAVIKRPHPKMINPWEPALAPLEDTFDSTHLYVTYNSSAAVQTVIAGIPTVAIHPASPAAAVTIPHIGRVRTPGRETWIHRLSWSNFDFTNGLDVDTCADYISRAYPQAQDEASMGVYDTEGLPL